MRIINNCRIRLTACFLAVVMALCTVLLSSCAPKQKSKTAWEAFGDTYFTLYDYSGMPERDFGELFALLCGRLEYYSKLFDIYFEYSGMNNLRTVNLSAGSAVTVDGEIIELIELSREMYEKTDGEVNIALGAVLRLWHDARTNLTAPPSSAELWEAYLHTDIDTIVTDREASTVMITDPEASIDVGAVAKGYAVEALCRYAEELGADSLVIDVGGNLRTVGKNFDGGGWPIYIQNPQGLEIQKSERLLSDTLGAVVTSGDYQRYYIHEGRKYHHIIDKDTLFPADYFSSVTVVCSDGAVGDALSTALFSMSYGDGVELLLKMPEVTRAVFITKDGEILTYSGQ